MTADKRILALTAGNLALLSLLVYGLFFSPRWGGRGTPDVPLSRVLPLKDLQEISLAGEEKTVLRREGGDWFLLLEGKPFPAESEKVERLLQAAGQARLLGTVTENRELWDRFGVGEEEPRRIVFSSPRGRGELILGDQDAQGRGWYIRFPGTDAVRLLSGSLSFYIDRNQAYWGRLRFFPPDLSGRDLGYLRVERGPPLHLFREKTPQGLVWVRAGGEAAGNQGSADSLADALARFAGSGFAVPPAAGGTGLEEPVLRISFTTGGGKTGTVSFGGPLGDSGLYCSGAMDGEPLPYLYKADVAVYRRIRDLIRESGGGP